MTFVDPYTEEDVCTRRESDRRLLSELASQPGGPIVVLQHNPMKPVAPVGYIGGYPYMLTNRSEVMRDYSEADVLLSISGHFHTGQELHTVGGVRYFTAAALQDPDYSYAMVTLRERDVTAEIRPLTLKDDLPLVDSHSHTEFAYCGVDISAAQAVH